MAIPFVQRARQAADDAKTGATLYIIAIVVAVLALIVAIVRR